MADNIKTRTLQLVIDNLITNYYALNNLKTIGIEINHSDLTKLQSVIDSLKKSKKNIK